MGEEKRAYDAGHYSFLELIRVLFQTAGPAFAKGALVKTGIQAAKSAKDVEFASLEDFLASIDAVDNPIARFEGKARHYQDGIFGLPACPFAASIKTYVGVAGGLPAEFKEVTAELNKPSGITEKLRIGAGAAVSPFCGVHQPIRSELGQHIKVAGRPLRVYQLGCKSAGGVKGLAEPLIAETGIDRMLVDRILDENMCCYCVRFDNPD